MTLSPSGSPTAAPGPFAMSPTRSFTVTPVAVRVVAPGDRFVGRTTGRRVPEDSERVVRGTGHPARLDGTGL